jgi:hypothetical protein
VSHNSQHSRPAQAIGMLFQDEATGRYYVSDRDGTSRWADELMARTEHQKWNVPTAEQSDAMATLDAIAIQPYPDTNLRRGSLNDVPRWAIAALAGVGIVGLAVSFALTRHSDDAALPSESQSAPLQAAIDACAPGANQGSEVADGGRTLIIDGAGETGSGMAVEGEVCLLTELNVSAAILAQMQGTTALQGRQSGSWDGYSASWTYHPDNGLDLIINEQ